MQFARVPHPCAEQDGIVRDGSLRSTFFKMKCEKTPPVELIARMFAAYNALFFNNSLQLPQFEAREEFEVAGRFTYPCLADPTADVRIILCSSQLDWYESFRDTLLHEMCHQYVRCVLCDMDEDSHSEAWNAIARRCGVRLMLDSPRS